MQATNLHKLIALMAHCPIAKSICNALRDYLLSSEQVGTALQCQPADVTKITRINDSLDDTLLE